MKFKLPDDAMPKVFLSRDEELQVEHETDELVRDTMDAFDAFLSNDRTFSKTHWKKVRAKEGFRVYRTRQQYATVLPHARAPSTSTKDLFARSVAGSFRSESGSSTASSSRGGGSYARAGVGPPALKSLVLSTMQQFPAIVLTGVIPGTMEDVSFGNIADNEELWRLRSSYIHDGNRDCKILATLKHATPENPFEFLGLKWAWRKLPAFLQQRDMVYAEKTNVVCDAQGNLILGYNLMHSIALPGIPELSQFDMMRLKVSVCFLTRQYDDRSVEFYCRAFQIPVGDMPMTLAVHLYAEDLLSAVNVVECSYMKKLMWLTRHRQRARRATGRHMRDTGNEVQDLDTATHCQGCERTLKRFAGLNRSIVMCRCCQRVVCGKCSSDRKIVLDVADDGAVTQRSMPFCVQCVLEARALPALDIARATAINWYDN